MGRRRARLVDESGVALFAALAIMLVVTVMVTSVIAYTSSTSRDASIKLFGQSAYALAEAGLNAGFAQLYSHYYSSSGTANNNSTVYSATWFTGTYSQQSPTSTGACTSTSTCMSWSVSSAAAGGSGPYTKETLVIQGQGSTPNPTGATALTRTVTEQIAVEQLPQRVSTPAYWAGIYSGRTGNSCDLQLGQGVNASAPVYVAGNLCLTSAASIEGANVTLTVLGNIRLQNGGADIGKTTALASVRVGGGCVKSNNGSYITPCPINTSTTQIWDRSGRTTALVPTASPLPSIDWAGIAAAQAASTISCTNGVSLSSTTFYLTPSSGVGSTGYTCTITDPVSSSTVGSIVYNSASHTLAVSGNVYLSGSLDISTPSATTYTGIANLFVAGTVGVANNSVLCVHVSAGQCDLANATNSSSPDYWDTTQTVLLIHSQGAMSATNLNFQGGLYSTTSISIGGGQSATQGPLVSPNLISPGQQLNLSYPNFSSVISGTVGTPPPNFTLTPTAGSGSF